MIEFVNFMVGEFVPAENFEIVVEEDGDRVDINVLVDKEYIASAIGKGGRVAKSIRALVKAASQKSDQDYYIHIEERE